MEPPRKLPDADRSFLRALYLTVPRARGIPLDELDTVRLERIGLDSFGLMEFVQRLEDQYAIQVAAEDLMSESFDTAGGIWEFVLDRQRRDG